MKIFKNIDEKFKEIGFTKVEENKYGATYEKQVTEFKYTQVIDIMHKASGNHLISSYEKEVNKNGFNNVVGLTAYETKLALKKMKKIGFA